MKDFLKTTLSFTNAIRNPNDLKCTKKCTKAFQELRQRLTVAPVLTLLVGSKDYAILTHASKDGLGCVLTQGNNVRSSSHGLCIESLKAIFIRSTYEIYTDHPVSSVLFLKV